jgi:hypothetical protein
MQMANERIDVSVFDMCSKYPHYRPLGFRNGRNAASLNLQALIANCEQWNALTSAVDPPRVELRDPFSGDE